MSLYELVDDNYTDKNTAHSYLSLYQPLLESMKDRTKNMLEVGIGSFGGDILMWSNFFQNATIYAIDILPGVEVIDSVRNKDNITLYHSTNGYNEDFVNREFISKGIKFDVLLDDGSHVLNDMKEFIRLYTPLIAENGILMIEDVQRIESFQELINATPENLKEYIKCYDLRKNKGRWDDLVFTIDMRKSVKF